MRTRKAFTLLEMLIVIGVILLLVTIAVAAYSRILNAMAVKATGTAMENCRSIMAEYEKTWPMTGIGYLPDGTADIHFPYLGGNNYYIGATWAPVNAPPINDASDNTSSLAGTVTGLPLRFPDTDGEAGPPAGWDYWIATQNASSGRAPNAVYKTACVMMYFMRVPAISQQIGGLSPKALLTNNQMGVTLYLTGGQPASAKQAPVLLDGWGNPIIFVPASGMLTQLQVGPLDPSTNKPTAVLKLIRTSGIYPSGTAAYAPPAPPVGINDRPFWASAGSDGTFDNGDDNVYSFKQ